MAGALFRQDVADLPGTRFWQLSFYDSFDSDPVAEGAEKNDYGVDSSLGWEF